MKYARNSLDNHDAPLSTAERILSRLKTKGPSSTLVLAQELELTPEAARLQVQKLLAEGLIEGQQEVSAGAGRPRQNWMLTARGHARFPDTHAYLTVQLIDLIKQLFGEQGLERLIAERENRMRDTYLDVCGPMDSLQQRLEKLASLRETEGYMARVEKDGETWLFIEDHCPICAAAQSCQGFCRSELQLFQAVTGDSGVVKREEHLLAGARRCVYRIHPR
ncbi:metalloregulator ArsR/SmtB family transcription factor [Undibacterium sp.]|jgi:predicted ArsR family transcriptional regulator|uniref:helix-turn-helix transcriptional regulator n=1 Tax=Undibacterium sp. TaxID=1914977 RepID=UPI002C5934A1|nr:metalloregulator ArsR/SmtB family transcription factor [Undibacterium sp.]HTD06215.1 metalloregulator ArsR/SmtB family transcription factor [Undibacterium sp.]